jgi:hypothetical protein
LSAWNAVSACAGRQRERTSGPGESSAAPSGKSGVALAVGALCGLLAPMLNYAFTFGQPIAETAVRCGTSREAAGHAIRKVAVPGGLLPNVAMGAFALYGVSSVYLGALGTSVGWALFQIDHDRQSFGCADRRTERRRARRAAHAVGPISC